VAGDASPARSAVAEEVWRRHTNARSCGSTSTT
jgi:hypothetical protein